MTCLHESLANRTTAVTGWKIVSMPQNQVTQKHDEMTTIFYLKYQITPVLKEKRGINKIKTFYIPFQNKYILIILSADLYKNNKLTTCQTIQLLLDLGATFDHCERNMAYRFFFLKK